jgi:3'(2'), 5'-bisphosphate nucleotidase
MVVASKSHRDQATDDYISRYAVRDMTSAGSSLKFCLVATGEADLYPGLAARWNGTPPPGTPFCAGRAAMSCASTTTSRLPMANPAGTTPSSSPYAPGVTLK